MALSQLRSALRQRPRLWASVGSAGARRFKASLWNEYEERGGPSYLDMQATTPVDPRVLDAMLPYYHGRFGNPHSRSHSYGLLW
eukprot:s4408_g2.t2